MKKKPTRTAKVHEHKFHFIRIRPEINWYEFEPADALFICEGCGLIKKVRTWEEQV